MTSLTTFYLSGIVGKEVFGGRWRRNWKIKDLLVNTMPSGTSDPNQQLVTGIRLKINKELRFYSFKSFYVTKAREVLNVTCTELI